LGEFMDMIILNGSASCPLSEPGGGPGYPSHWFWGISQFGCIPGAFGMKQGRV